MRAVGYEHCLPVDDPACLQDFNVDDPVPGDLDLLVEIEAIAVNPVDYKIRQRAEPEPGSYRILGWDATGVVRETGRQVTLFKPGDQVWYAGELNRPGCNAQLQCVNQNLAAHKPNSLRYDQAAAMPLTTITAWEILFDRLGFVPNQPNEDKHLLIVGAAGGVGSMLTQIAKRLARTTVTGTASRDATREWLLTIGADHVIDHSRPISEELARIGVKDVTHVASLTHTHQHFDELVKILRPQGRLTLIDDPQTPLDIKAMKQKSLSLHWEFMFTRSMFRTEDMIKQHRILDEMAGYVDQGIIRSTVNDHYGKICADNLRRAHRQLESNTTIGKIVLEGF